MSAEKQNRATEALNSIADAIGQTPLVRLNRIGKINGHNLFAKCEFMNPGGSVKDRIAFHMLKAAEKEGKLKAGQLIVEATGGNTGIGLAMAATLAGYKLLCVMSEKVGKQKVEMMKLFGAEVLVVAGGKSPDDPLHFINQAKQIARERNAWFADQFDNKDNFAAHYQTTGPEIWEQSEGKVDALVAGIGTGGTLCGAGQFLKEQKPGLELVLADPVGSLLSSFHEGKEGTVGSYLVEGIGQDFIPGIVDLKKIDKAYQVSDQESLKMTYELLSKEAIFVGASSGCNLAAAIKYCQNSSARELNVVVVLPSSGHLYTSTVFNKEWLQARSHSIEI
ncbi:MAG: cysteine synthase family protein [Candidatus Obscuribacterales bacterium]|nr:cysteine synthase family protein [Candidatus Obscuribacterales bacterium]